MPKLCCVLVCGHAGEFGVTDPQMEYSRDWNACKRGNLHQVDLSFDFARSSHVCSHHSFDVMKAHLECVVIKATDKQRLMTRESLIHDVLWATGTHELCRIDEGFVLGKRTASGGASSSSTQQPDELMATFLLTHPFLAPMRDSFTYSILMCILLSVLHLNGVPGYVFGDHFVLTVALKD